MFTESEKIELSERDQMRLAEFLINPQELTDAMKNAIRKRLEKESDTSWEEFFNSEKFPDFMFI